MPAYLHLIDRGLSVDTNEIIITHVGVQTPTSETTFETEGIATIILCLCMEFV